jgi:hypothetical protein
VAHNREIQADRAEVAELLRRTPAAASMIVASLDAGKRVDEGLVTHV